jgi:HK97 family phage major capsid protein
MKLNILRDKRNTKVAEARGLLDKAAAENRELTEDEAKKYDALMQEVDSLNANIKRAERLENVEEDLEVAEPAKAKAQRAQGAEAKKEFSSLGEFMYAVVKNPNDPRLNYVEFEKPGTQAEQTMGTGSEGGFAVPTQFGDQLLQVSPQDAVIEGRSMVIPAGSPPDAAISFPALDQTGDVPDNVYGGVAVEWIGEGETKPSTGASLRQIILEPKEVAGHIPVTDKLLRNWLAAGAVLQKLLSGALLSAREHAFLLGNGIAKPLGIIPSGAAYLVNRTTTNTVVYADIVNMVSRLLMRGGSPYWLASQSVYAKLATMEDTEGHLIWQPNAIVGSPGSLMGYPVFWHERSPLLGVKGDLTLVNTNPYYMIKQGSGPFVGSGFINDDFVKNKQRIKIFQLVDGQPWLTAPFKQESGYEVSPFVVLDVPAG